MCHSQGDVDISTFYWGVDPVRVIPAFAPAISASSSGTSSTASVWPSCTSPGRPISIGGHQCQRIESAVLCNDAHLGHVGVHILLAPLKEEHVGPSSIGPATIAACCLVERFDRVLRAQSGIDNQ